MSNKEAMRAQLSLLEAKEKKLNDMVVEHCKASAQMKNALEFALRLTDEGMQAEARIHTELAEVKTAIAEPKVAQNKQGQ